MTQFTYLYPPPLGRPAAVVRNRRDVADRFHFEADSLQRTDCRLAAGTRTLDADVERAHADGLRGVAGVQRRLRRRERRALARALEADPAGARPRDDVALGVGDRHGRVVERRVDVRQPVVHDALLAALLEGLLALAGGAFLLFFFREAGVGGCFSLRHGQITFFFAIAPLRGPLRVRALVLVRWPRTGRPRRCRRPR